MKIPATISHDQRRVICSVINFDTFEQGGGPLAEPDVLEFFVYSYFAHLVPKLRPKLKPHAQQMLDSAMKELIVANS